MLPNLRQVIRVLVRLAAIFTVGLISEALVLAQQEAEPPVLPEQTPMTADGTALAERVIVTGSNIPTAQEVGPNPVLELNRDYIQKSGERSTEELLRNQPVANANGVPSSGNINRIGRQGASISLRGLDPGATLVLIDGHRISPHPTGTGNGIESFFDLNTIPRAAIESIEILKDGASTTYGADAIAGVVNIKLRHDYQGGEISAEYGNSSNTDSGETSASLLFGTGDQNTSLTGVANYYSRNSIFTRDRKYDLPQGRSFNASPFNLEISRAAAEAAAGRPITEVPSFDSEGNPIDTFFAHAPFFTNGSAPGSDYVFTTDRAVKFPASHYNAVLPETERYGAFLNADHKVFGDQLAAYADLFFQRADVTHGTAPATTADFAAPGGNPVRPLAIPPPTAGLIVGGPSYADVGLSPTAYNPFNPFDQIISGGSRGRLFDLGLREFDAETDLFFTTVGLRGDKLFGGSWGYDAAFRYSHIESTAEFHGVVSTRRFQRILNAADPIFDPASSQFIGTTVPYNPFGDYRVPITTNKWFGPYAVVTPREVDTGTLSVFDLNMYSTDIWQMPAGSIGIAFGAQFRHETQDQEPDRLFMSGEVLGLGQTSPLHGTGDSYAGYAETSIPIFGGNFRAPAFYALDLTAAVRFEAFDNGNNVMVPKFGMRWQPVDDSLTIRATWGEGFRQPSLGERGFSSAMGVEAVVDPKTGKMVVDLPVTVLSNPTLQPEDSRNFTAGVVYSPKPVPGLTLTVDLFNIETIGWINPNQSAQDALERIVAGHGSSGESTIRDANGDLTHLTYLLFINSGTQKVRGSDFGISYELPTSIGTFRSLTQVTYLDSYQFSPVPGATEKELRSSPTDASDDAYLKWKGISKLEWEWRGLDAVFTAHYLDGFHEIIFAGKGIAPNFPDFKNEHWVNQTWLFDFQVSYELGHEQPLQPNEPRFHNGWPTWQGLLDRTRLTIGINNIFNHDPPKSVDNFPRFIYDPTGRFVYVSVTKKF